MIWFWLSLATSVLWGLSYAVSGYLSRTLSGEAIMLFTYTIGLPIYAAIAWYNGTLPEFMAMWRWPSFGWGLAMVGAFVFGNLFILYAFRLTGNPFLVSVVEMTYPVFVLLLGLALFQMGSLTLVSAISFLLIFAGLGLLVYVKP